jgi:hypothetical protein
MAKASMASAEPLASKRESLIAFCPFSDPNGCAETTASFCLPYAIG